MFKIQLLNKIAPEGIVDFSPEFYEVASEFRTPDALLVRSAKVSPTLPLTVKAIARAGAGVNNIPLSAMTDHGIVVFNTPGANANAVKELVLLGIFLSSRPAIKAAQWVKGLNLVGAELSAAVEQGKSQFVGPEIAGKTLGVIGLGAIGALVANSARDLGMNVIGFDPYISIDAAWRLSRDVQRAENLESLISRSDYITLHIPATADTSGLINGERIKQMKKGVRLLNFARSELVVEKDLLEAVSGGKIASYICDFANEKMLNGENIVCLPHLGASTPEAEINCAQMAVRQLRDFLENGNIANSVNFPKCKMEDPIPVGGARLCVSNRNVPNMVGQITTVLANARCNISAMINQNRGEVAYNIINLDSEIPDSAIEDICQIDGIIKMRVISG